MNGKRLEDAPEKIWEYEQQSYDTLTREDLRYSEMTEGERRLIHGLIQYAKPKRILEIGVAEGGGSIVLLNAIKDDLDASLTSIDVAERVYDDKEKFVGFACKEKYEANKQWKLYVGKDPSGIIEGLSVDGKYDFVILDTAHIHPIESLNFLTVLPFLTHDCMVILHDIGTYATPFFLDMKFPQVFFATKLLFDTMIGEKRILPLGEYSSPRHFSNIGVCQLNDDSKKYLGNVFSMLTFPWGLIPSDIDKISLLLEKYYRKEYYDSFLAGYRYAQEQLRFSISGGLKPDARLNTNPFSYQKKKVIFYGYGYFARNLFTVPTIFSHPVTEIWDKFEEESDVEINGTEHLIRKPDYHVGEKDGILIVLTLDPDNKTTQEEVKSELKGHGFSHVIHYLELDVIE